MRNCTRPSPCLLYISYRKEYYIVVVWSSDYARTHANRNSNYIVLHYYYITCPLFPVIDFLVISHIIIFLKLLKFLKNNYFKNKTKKKKL